MFRWTIIAGCTVAAAASILAWRASNGLETDLEGAVDAVSPSALSVSRDDWTPSANATTGFISKTYLSPTGSSHPYVVFVPLTYDGKHEIATILFLHGSGSTKGGLHPPIQESLGSYIRQHADTFSYLVVFPQAERPVWSNSENTALVLGILDQTLKEYRTDPHRVYLTGLSMGGTGTWDLAAANPGRWAAIVPICGRTNPALAPQIKNIPCWVFHGAADQSVPVKNSREMVAALRQAGGSPRYSEYADVQHACWDQAYATPELWAWLARQNRK